MFSCTYNYEGMSHSGVSVGRGILNGIFGNLYNYISSNQTLLLSNMTLKTETDFVYEPTTEEFREFRESEDKSSLKLFSGYIGHPIRTLGIKGVGIKINGRKQHISLVFNVSTEFLLYKHLVSFMDIDTRLKDIIEYTYNLDMTPPDMIISFMKLCKSNNYTCSCSLHVVSYDSLHRVGEIEKECKILPSTTFDINMNRFKNIRLCVYFQLLY